VFVIIFKVIKSEFKNPGMTLFANCSAKRNGNFKMQCKVAMTNAVNTIKPSNPLILIAQIGFV